MNLQPPEDCSFPVNQAVDNSPHEEGTMAKSIGKVLHEMRKKKELSLNDLARLSGVSRSMLSQVETGRSIPSVFILCKIAHTFDVPVTAFLTAEEEERPSLLSAEETPLRVSSDGKCAWRSLAETQRERRIKFYEITLRAGGIEKIPSYPTGSKTILTVSTGQVLVALGGQRHRLNEGDVFEFSSSAAHAYINPSHEQTILYLILQLPQSL